MVIDSSALLAIILDEPERVAFVDAIEADTERLISAVNVFESSIVLEARNGTDSVDDLDQLLTRIGADVRSFGNADLDVARRAFRIYGKGRHPAGLNFGDCIAYALAKNTGNALLYKGDDFVRTDIALAVVA
ncbi:MAG: type II toxin-antitoxin system VapC family toxin [Candidatus Eremiobacteraeota bacterium]|nr:type II toxin-antitoxin system VapC family toxin [Candidatus Eremiobacteraeota bacterium]